MLESLRVFARSVDAGAMSGQSALLRERFSANVDIYAVSRQYGCSCVESKCVVEQTLQHKLCVLSKCL